MQQLTTFPLSVLGFPLAYDLPPFKPPAAHPSMPHLANRLSLPIQLVEVASQQCEQVAATICVLVLSYLFLVAIAPSNKTPTFYGPPTAAPQWLWQRQQQQCQQQQQQLHYEKYATLNLSMSVLL